MPAYEQITSDLRLTYNRAAKERSGMRDAPWKQAQRERFLGFLRNAGCQTLLEIGAGHGVSGKFFQEQGLEVTCTDLSPELVEHCRRQGLKAFEMDFLHLEFPAASFDAVFGMNCLLHVPRLELPRVLLALRHVIRLGGLFYWGQYGGNDSEGVRTDDDYEPKRFFSSLTDDAIQAEAAAAYEILDFRTTPMGSLVYQALVLRRPAAPDARRVGADRLRSAEADRKLTN